MKNGVLLHKNLIVFFPAHSVFLNVTVGKYIEYYYMHANFSFTKVNLLLWSAPHSSLHQLIFVEAARVRGHSSASLLRNNNSSSVWLTIPFLPDSSWCCSDSAWVLSTRFAGVATRQRCQFWGEAANCESKQLDCSLGDASLKFKDDDCNYSEIMCCPQVFCSSLDCSRDFWVRTTKHYNILTRTWSLKWN